MPDSCNACPSLHRDQLDASYDKLKALRQEEAALLAELAAQQASTSSSTDELAGLQAQLDDAARRKVRSCRDVTLSGLRTCAISMLSSSSTSESICSVACFHVKLQLLH
jgi:hypothetical protein